MLNPLHNILIDRFQADALPHAVLLLGTASVATTLVQGLIDELRLNPADYLLFDSTEPIKIIDARRIKSFVQLTRFTSPIKLVFVADATALTPEAANALLKTIEEPPVGTHIILATTKADALLPTICSRCQRINLGVMERELGSGSDIPLLERRELASSFQIAKELAASDASLPTIFTRWAHQLANEPATERNQRWQSVVLDYLGPAQTSVNRRLLLDNFFLEIYNSD